MTACVHICVAAHYAAYELNRHLLLVLCCDCAGELCGDCRNGYGVSVLLNKCVTCHDASGLLIAVLSESQKVACSVDVPFMICFTVLIDALVLTGLLLLVKAFPAWLYPCLFYLQVSY